MAVLSNTGIRAGASGAGADPYIVKRSARFEDLDSAYLHWTPSAAGNRRKMTFSFWIKRNKLTISNRRVFGIESAAGHQFNIMFDPTDHFYFQGTGTGGSSYVLLTNAQFRDPSAWYHFVVAIDTEQSTASDRVNIYINGVKETSFNSSYEDYPDEDLDLSWNLAEKLHIGSLDTLGNGLLAATLADIHVIDGQQLAGTDFGESDSTTGQWVPKKYTGSYGTNGVHLAMDPANAGTSYSNQLSITNATGWHTSPYDQDAGFNGIIGSGSAGYAQVTGASNPNSITFTPPGGIAYSSKVEVYIINTANQVSVNGGTLQSISADTWVTVASGSGTLTSLKFERASTSGASFSGIRIDDKLLVDHTTIGYDSSGNNNHWHENNIFGSEHTVANENFKAIGYVGTGSSGHAINVGFKPDLIWIKERGGSANHKWHDVIRGTNLQLQSNTDDGDETITNQVTSFDTNGFTLGDTIDANQSGEDFVAWCWKAGGTGVANDTGTLDSTVSANTEAGFSIVKYNSGGSTGNYTVGHGLGKAPDLIFHKRTDDTGNWWVYHSSVITDMEDYLQLNSDAAKATNSAEMWGASAPTSTVFGTRVGDLIGASQDAIAYCWAETEGVSKFGSFEGSSSTLTFECGFAPAYVLIKCHDTAGQEWIIKTKTLGSGELQAHHHSQETFSRVVNFLPNGFSVNGGQGPVNYAGRNYIFIAFAGNPEGDLDLLADVPGAPYDNELNGGGNYATLNPLACSDGTPTKNGNLGMAASTGGHQIVAASMAVSSGKWWWEATIKALSPDYICFGMWDTSTELEPTLPGYANTDSWSVQQNTGKIYWGGHYNSTTISTYAAGDDIAIAYDNGSCYVYKNGVIENSGNPVVTGLTGDWAPIFHGVTSTWEWENINFGQRSFKYTPRTDHKGLNTYNISEPTVAKGNSGFDIQKWTGNATDDRDIDGYLFSPDLVWIKERNSTGDHHVFDIVRGANKAIRTNEPDAEVTTTDELKQFNSDGFRLGDGGDVNATSTTTVGWAWDAGSAGSNTSVSAGDLNSATYDTSEDWSASFANGAGNTTDVGQAFRGITDATGTALGSTFLSLTDVAFDVTSTISVWVHDPGSIAVSIEYNGTTYTKQPATKFGWTDFTVPSGSNSGTLKAKLASSGDEIRGVKIDGKILVDSNVTPPNMPSIASEYRVNTDTGFSIVTATGSSSSAGTVAHGLNASIDFIIAKLRVTAGNGYNQDWQVYHKELGNTKGLQLNSNGSVETSSALWNNTSPTSSVFSIGASSRWDGALVAYCWSEVAGYSKFGTYTGNGNADGPFVWCGFRPRWIMTKNSGASEHWAIYDTSRSEFNQADDPLNANISNAEFEDYSSGEVDILSNGFKLRGNWGATNTSSGVYVFAAFAESPFKYSNAR